MLEFLESDPSIIAVRTSGHLSRDEIEAMLTRLEERLALPAPTHMFVEVRNFSGFDLEGFGNYVRRVTALIGKLERLDRVAIVANQRWLRWAARVESALLPNVTYETFTPAQRDQALAWVEGRIARPHASAISIIETDRPDVAGFAIDGKLSAEDLEAVTRHFEKMLEQEGRVRLLGRIRNLGGMDLSSLAGRDFFRMKAGLAKKVDRYALVGGPGWFEGWVKFLDNLLPMEIRHFAAGDEAEAWSWLGAQPKSERRLDP